MAWLQSSHLLTLLTTAGCAPQATPCVLQEARLELERLIAAGSHDMSLQQLSGAFPYTLDAFQQRSVESFLQGKSAVSSCHKRQLQFEQLQSSWCSGSKLMVVWRHI